LPICCRIAVVDRRFLGYWNREQAARRHAGKNLPRGWRNDPRPEMHAVTDVYVEMLARIRQQKRLSALTDDPR